MFFIFSVKYTDQAHRCCTPVTGHILAHPYTFAPISGIVCLPRVSIVPKPACTSYYTTVKTKDKCFLNTQVNQIGAELRMDENN